jgi:glycosyltransferase involved in cell wall biosynthesis
MPTYNHAEFVREAIMSAVEQDYPNLELVAGDDGSTDGTVDIIIECAREYPNRVVALVDQEHLGPTCNANRTLRACRGKYVAFHSGDDVLLPGKIARQVEWLEADECRVICVHDVDVFDSETGKTQSLYSPPLKSGQGAAALVRDGNMFSGGTVMARASALPSYGFDERLPIVSDWKLWIDCLASGGLFGYVDGIYARYRRHAKNLSADARPSDPSFLARMSDCLATLTLVETSYPHLVRYCRNKRAQYLEVISGWYVMRGEKSNARVYYASAMKEYLMMTCERLPQPMQSALLAPSFAAVAKRLNRFPNLSNH